MSTAEVTDIATRPRDTSPAEMTVEQMVVQAQKIQLLMDKVLKKDEHYGVIPGTGTKEKPAKPTLLKPGAEKLCLMFRLDPEYDVMQTVETAERISYMVRCTLYHIPTGARIASGLGSCNSREEKYVRPAAKKCPACGKEAIIKGKDEYERDPAFKGGWLCFAKKGGCGAKYKAGDETIERQDSGIKDPADLANTLLKMACKRALVAAVLNGTAASDFFAQDLEDLTEKAAEYTPPAKEAGADPKAQTAVASTAAPATSGTASAKAPTGTTTPTGGIATVAAPTGTNSAVPKGAAVAAPSTDGVATTSKPPRANTIKHDGTMASHKQVAYLHALKTKAGVSPCDGKCAKNTTKFMKRLGREVPVTVRCIYHTQLAGFKDCDDKPITTSKDLSEGQISSLIERYEAHVAKDEAATAQIRSGETAPPDDELSEVRAAIEDKKDPEAVVNELCEIFRCPTLDDLPRAEVPAALALVMAYGTNAYGDVLARVRP